MPTTGGTWDTASTPSNAQKLVELAKGGEDRDPTRLKTKHLTLRAAMRGNLSQRREEGGTRSRPGHPVGELDTHAHLESMRRGPEFTQRQGPGGRWLLRSRSACAPSPVLPTPTQTGNAPVAKT